MKADSSLELCKVIRNLFRKEVFVLKLVNSLKYPIIRHFLLNNFLLRVLGRPLIVKFLKNILSPSIVLQNVLDELFLILFIQDDIIWLQLYTSAMFP